MILSATDRVALILGRAIVRAEILASRVEELEAAAKQRSDEAQQKNG